MTKSKINWSLNWESDKIQLKHLDKYKGRNKGLDLGYGVFAKSRINKGEIITIFGGYIIPLNKARNISIQLQEYFYQIHDRYFYGPINKSQISIGEHFNHSCSPNAGFKDSITLIATSTISKGDEVTIDYATCITTNKFNFQCDCGSNDCRRYITGNDWRILKLQKKYKNYFQPYITEKIKKITN